MVVTTRAEVAAAVVAALDSVAGLRPANPVTITASPLVPRRFDALAVDLTPELVEARVVGLVVPLAPALAAAEEAVRGALRCTEWADATLRLVVADLDAGAFTTITRSGRDIPPRPGS